MNFSFNTTPAIRCGSGLSGQIANLAGSFLGDRVLVVTDRDIIKLGLADSALESLKASGREIAVFDDTKPDPSIGLLNEAITKAGEFGATSIVGFGGGSSLDLAKLTSLIAGSGENLDDAWGVGNAKGPRLPLVLVPTTAGTGSEVTPVSIITVEDAEKRGVSSPVILPDMAILDAQLTLGLPRSTTAATGIDAMVHAIEAYTSRSINNNEISRTLAVRALNLLGANIEVVCADGTNVEAREAMLLGSMLAGMAFANSPVAAVHALAYPIGGMFHVPHGLSNALILCEVMRFNQTVCYQEYSDLAPHVFADLDCHPPGQGRSAAFIERLGQLSERTGLRSRLRDVGIDEKSLPVMAAAAMKQTRLLVNNPRDMSEADALAIYKAAW